MKKLFLLALATASTASMFGQYVNNINDKFREGVSLSVEWANLDALTSTSDLRSGSGSNDKFYINDYKANAVLVYGELGLEKTMPVPSGNLWVCNNVDDAGNIIVRGSNEVWPGTGNYPGCFYAGTAGNLIFIIDSKTDEWADVKYDINQGPDGRWDAFGHVAYDALAPDYWQILATSDQGNTGTILDFIFDGASKACTGYGAIAAVNHSAFNETTSAKFQTLGSGMYYGVPNEYGEYPFAAVYGNPYAGLTGYDPTGKNLTNGIQRYEWTDDDGVMKWQASGEYFITPQHSDIGGFMLFELGGKQYVVYPGGNSTTHAGDAIAIAEVGFTNTPVGDATLDAPYLVARAFGASNDVGTPLYFAGSMHQYLNVQPVEGDPNSVYIYCYTQKAPMVKFKFTVAEGAGVDNIAVDSNADAPVEYYNIDGVKVAQPALGNIYIRKQGTSVAKVVY